MNYIGCGYVLFYCEKMLVGLMVVDCWGEMLYCFCYFYCGYDDFVVVLFWVVQVLMFIENCDLFDEFWLNMNLVVDWVCFSCVILGCVGCMVSDDFDVLGGSILVIQIEKYCYFLDGIICDGSEKLCQMVLGSVCVYCDGEEILLVCYWIFVDYFNIVLFFVVFGYGEVNGLGDGLWVWFVVDFVEVNVLLVVFDDNGLCFVVQGCVLYQVVVLMIVYCWLLFYLLFKGCDVFVCFFESYVCLFVENGLISLVLCDVVLVELLKFCDMVKNFVLLLVEVGKGVVVICNWLVGIFDVLFY